MDRKLLQVLKLREVGTGKSKKLAKRVAAHKMWQSIQDGPPEGNAYPGFEGEEEVSFVLSLVQHLLWP